MKNKKASIIFLLGSQSISGGTNVIFEHAAGLQRRGYYVVICTEYHVDYESVSWHPYGSDLIFVTYDEVSTSLIIGFSGSMYSSISSSFFKFLAICIARPDALIMFLSLA